jgi:heme-degrading monooxygenase HmoA
VIVREFRVNAGCEKDFELVFRPDGVWAGLLQRRSQGYIGIELKAVAPEDRRYEVRDLWRSHRSFEVFRDSYQADIERFRDWLAGKEMIEQETLLGAFYSDEPNEGDDAGLVSA